MIERGRQALCASAGPHVEAVHHKTGVKSGLAHAADVSRFARAFQPMHQNDVSPRRRRLLKLHEHLHIRLGAIKPGLQREAERVDRPSPQMTGDRLQMRIREERSKGLQIMIVAAAPSILNPDLFEFLICSTDPGAAWRLSPMRCVPAISGSLRGCSSVELRALSSRDNPQAAYTADNQARRRHGRYPERTRTAAKNRFPKLREPVV